MQTKDTILIIEDEKNICDFISTTLKAQGYKTITTGQGREGISLTASQCPEIILLDACDYMDRCRLEENEVLLTALRMEYDILINQAVKCLEKAHKIHQRVEELYIPNMNFDKIQQLGDQLIEELKGL